MSKEFKDLSYDLHTGWWTDSRGRKIFLRMTTAPGSREARGFSVSGEHLKKLMDGLSESEQRETMRSIWNNRQEILDTIDPLV